MANGKSIEAVAELTATSLKSTILTIDQLNQSYQFAEMKCGLDERGRSLKWFPDRITVNASPFGSPDNLQSKTLEEACLEPGKIKIDWFALGQHGILTEVTKVIYSKYDIDGNTDASFDLHKNNLSPFGEVFFDDPNSIGIFDGLHNPELMAKWRRMQLNQAKSFLTEGEFFNPLKAIKRGYTVLKLDGQIDKAHQMASLLALPEAQLYRMASELDVLCRYLSEPSKKWKPFQVCGIITEMLHVIDPNIANAPMPNYVQNRSWRDRLLATTEGYQQELTKNLNDGHYDIIVGSVVAGSDHFDLAKQKLTDVSALIKHIVSQKTLITLKELALFNDILE